MVGCPGYASYGYTHYGYTYYGDLQQLQRDGALAGDDRSVVVRGHDVCASHAACRGLGRLDARLLR
eukprot:scaffold3315_cov62-Phaeocystis_antarctica.AAC.5